ncbi:MAG: hypothetical protein K0S61_2918 [Anaerocolumna sp.]|nr:hypothetical protein [Anaerocolumna sp.]
MNEYLLINMLSEISPELLEDNYLDKDLKKKETPFWKRVFSFLKSTDDSKDFIEPFTITNTDEQYQEHVEALTVETDNDDEYTIQEEEPQQRNFSITVFKKKINRLFTIISGVVATIIFIIGIVIFLIRKIRNIKRSKVQISF